MANNYYLELEESDWLGYFDEHKRHGRKCPVCRQSLDIDSTYDDELIQCQSCGWSETLENDQY